MNENYSNVCTKYDKVAKWYDENHLEQFELKKPYLDLVETKITAGANILDLGCGTGEPIARFFIEKKYNLIGIDGAEKMIAICKKKFPNNIWLVEDMSNIALAERFEAIIMWDSLFHLGFVKQREMFQLIQSYAKKGTVLLFNTGIKKEEVISNWAGQEFYHASLDIAEYKALLAKYGFVILQNDITDENTAIWLAQKI